MGSRQRSILLKIRSAASRGGGPPRVRRRLLLERLGDRRVLAAIAGEVFSDFDESLRREAGEVGLAQRLVYVDENRNAELDAGEPVALTDETGQFAFGELEPGDYQVRLFNGTASQSQTYPLEPELGPSPIDISGSIEVTAASPTSAVALTSGGIVVADFSTGQKTPVAVGQSLTRMSGLPGGELLVLGSESSEAWRVNPAGGAVAPVELSGPGQSTLWSDLAIDGSGHGVLLEQSGGPSQVRAVDASDEEAGIVVSSTSSTVPGDARALTSATGTRSVIGWDAQGGLDLMLWSNATATKILAEPVSVPGAAEMLAFDDGAGVLVLRSGDGGVSVHDVDAGFATLHEFSDVTGPVALDPERELLISVSPDDATLRLHDLRDGSVLGGSLIDLSALGSVSGLVPAGSPDAAFVVGTAGIAMIKLDRPSPGEAVVGEDAAAGPLRFGVHVRGDNAAPAYSASPSFTVAEDSELSVSAPAAISGAADGDGDSFVLLPAGSPSDGVATVSPRGGFIYRPDANFAGTDTVPILLHDGRDVAAAEIEIQVTAVPDDPIAVDVTADPIPENLEVGAPVGVVEVIDVDLGVPHLIAVDDPRFEVIGGELVFVGGELDYETEWTIPLTITATDTQTGASLSSPVSLTVTDENDPITGIRPGSAFVFENAPGDVVTEIVVEDEDFEQFHELTVDDSRFLVEFGDLRLADGVFLNYEAEQTVVVHVTATDVVHGDSFTAPVTITVRDLPEQPAEIALSHDEVMELEPGDVVGEVLVDGFSSASNHEFTVDDGRFEIADGTLKLMDDVWVQRANQQEIQLEITAQDAGRVHPAVSATFVIQVVENDTPFHNEDDPFDVDDNGTVSALDALAIINYLNQYGPGPVGPGDPGFGFDVNGDGRVSALDALLILNELNRISRGTPLADGEGEQPSSPSTPRIKEDHATAPGRLDGHLADEALESVSREWVGGGDVGDTAGEKLLADSDSDAERSERPVRRDDAMTSGRPELSEASEASDRELFAAIDRVVQVLASRG